MPPASARAVARRCSSRSSPRTHGAQNAAAVLARGGAASLPALEAELAKTDDTGARGRLVRVLVAIHDPAVAPLLVRAASAGWVEGDDLIAVAGALGALHQVHELRDPRGEGSGRSTCGSAAAAIEVSMLEGAGALVELGRRGSAPAAPPRDRAARGRACGDVSRRAGERDRERCGRLVAGRDAVGAQRSGRARGDARGDDRGARDGAGLRPPLPARRRHRDARRRRGVTRAGRRDRAHVEASRCGRSRRWRSARRHGPRRST